jgi:membrane protein DedA with SNARE-associated domain
MDLLLHWINQFGYAGIFGLLVLGIVGLPVPDETLLTFAGYLVWRGDLKLVPAIAAAFLGSVCGITVSYTLGRLTGYFLVERYGARVRMGPERVHMVHDWFRRLGRFTLTFGYYVPGVRHLTAYVAGASELEYPVFALFAYPGAFLWSVSFISLGYLLGDRWSQASADMHRVVLIVCGVIAIVVAGWFLWGRPGRRPRKQA